MKKALGIIVAMMLGTVGAKAQLSVEAGWQKTQLINTTVASDGYRSYLYTWSDGFYAGMGSFYAMPVKGLSLKYSILYHYATGTETDALKLFGDPHYEAASKGQVTTDEHYLSVPGVVDYSITLTPWLKGFVFAGAEVVYCLSSKTYSSWPGLDGTNHWNVDHFGGGTNYNGYRRFDLGVLGGAGVELLGRVRLEFGVDYGLLDRSEAAELLHRFSLHAGIALLF